MEPRPSKLRIALCSDFFYPNIGGVEMHIYQLGHYLVEHGNKVFLSFILFSRFLTYIAPSLAKVIVITHQYGNRKGVRYLKNGIKVYYLPYPRFASNSTFPTFSCAFPIIRNIFIREQINVVHAHQVFCINTLFNFMRYLLHFFAQYCSFIGHEALRFARTMGIATVFTDHSLFGFKEVHVIITNRVYFIIYLFACYLHLIYYLNTFITKFHCLDKCLI